jgi:formate/nitrite transporter FocA (FNT family)
MKETIRSSIFAGIYIGIAGFGFLAASTQSQYGALAGAILFALGLLSIVGYKLKLFTGTAGFIMKDEIGTLVTILLGNIFGCLLIALLTSCSPMSDAIHDAAYNIMMTRSRSGAIGCGLLAIGCGLLMTTAVHFARQKNITPLFFAVPLFIICGFPHCVADAFYYLTIPEYLNIEIIVIYMATVVGNAIGCNLYRLILSKEQYG